MSPSKLLGRWAVPLSGVRGDSWVAWREVASPAPVPGEGPAASAAFGAHFGSSAAFGAGFGSIPVAGATDGGTSRVSEGLPPAPMFSCRAQ